MLYDSLWQHPWPLWAPWLRLRVKYRRIRYCLTLNSFRPWSPMCRHRPLSSAIITQGNEEFISGPRPNCPAAPWGNEGFGGREDSGRGAGSPCRSILMSDCDHQTMGPLPLGMQAGRTSDDIARWGDNLLHFDPWEVSPYLEILAPNPRPECQSLIAF